MRYCLLFYRKCFCSFLIPKKKYGIAKGDIFFLKKIVSSSMRLETVGGGNTEQRHLFDASSLRVL